MTVQLAENVSDMRDQFNDINPKLGASNARLPSGVGPILFQSDFGRSGTARSLLRLWHEPKRCVAGHQFENRVKREKRCVGIQRALGDVGIGS